MKAVKILAWVVGSIAVLVVIALAVGLNSSFQTWATRKAVAGQPGMKLEVARVSAGFSGAEISDLRFSQEGLTVTAKNVTAKFSAWDYLTSKRINVDSLVADQLEVDLRTPKTAPSSSAPAAGPASKSATTSAPPPPKPVTPADAKARFEGLLKGAQLPVDLRIAQLIAKGRALLTEQQVVVFDVKAADLATGQRGRLDLTIDFADSTANAEVRGLRATGNATVQIATDRRINALGLDATATPMGPRLKGDQLKLSAKAETAAAGGDESYVADVSLVRAGKAEPLVKIAAQFLSASREIAGTWDVSLRSEQLAGFLQEMGWPDVAATGTGKFNLKPDTSAIAASGDLQAQLSKLQLLNPALAALGSAQLKTSFDGGLADNVARLDKLNLELASADGRKLAQISSLQKVSYALVGRRVVLTDPKAELARISLQAIPLAWAQPFLKPMVVDSGDLSLVLAIEAEPDGSRIRTRAIEPLALRTVTLRQGDRKLVDRVTLTLRPNLDYSATRLVAQIAELNASMPDGDTLAANISADITNLASTPAIAFTAQLQAKAVTALKPYVPVPTGPLSITKHVEGRYDGQSLHFTKLTATAMRENNTLLTTIELLQPARVELKTGTFSATKPDASAVRLKLGEIPLAWAEAFVAKSKLAGSLAGATVDVALRTYDDLTLTTVEPLALRGVTATIDGQTFAQTLDLAADLTATKRGNTIVYDLRQLDVKQGPTSLAALKVSGETKLGSKLVLTAKGELQADAAAALQTQPLVAPHVTLARGRLNATFETNLGDSTQAKATVTARNLVAKQDNRVLGDLDLTLNATLKPDGSGSLQLPVTLTNGARKSDLSIDGAFGKSSDQKTFLFTGKVASNHLVVDDFQPLAALAPTSSAEPAKPAASTPPAPAPSNRTVVRAPGATSAPSSAPGARDTVPFWNAVNGKFDVDLKRVQYGKDYDGSVRGTASITPSRLALDGLDGKFKDKPFKLTGGITFTATQPKPYALTGSIDVSGVDVGPILQASNPNAKPQLETTVRVAGKFNGSGTNLSTLFDSTTGQFDVTGSKGTLRAISGQTGTAVSAVASIAGLLGAAKGSNSTVAASTLLREMTEMPFDQFTMRVERGADLNLKLTTVEFLSPSTRITGTGSVTHQAGVPITNQPLHLEMRIAGKQHMLRMLDEARVLGETVDDKGYGQMRAPFKLSGTVSQIQDNLWSVLLSTALEMRSDLQNSRTPSQQPQQTQQQQPGVRTNVRPR